MKEKIIIRGARTHNLKNISLEIPKNKLVVVTGLSGSGKSSLAFDTVYTEGQHRYTESFSHYARQFLNLQTRPDVDQIEGLSPTVAIDGRTTFWNPRSTVGTVTEIYDYLRILFARIGQAQCPSCNGKLSKQNLEQILKKISENYPIEEITILSPVNGDQKTEIKQILEEIKKAGYLRVRINGFFYFLEEALKLILGKDKKHKIEIVIDGPNEREIKAHLQFPVSAIERLKFSLKKSLEIGNGTLIIHYLGKDLFFSERLFCSCCHLSFPDLEPRTFSFNSPYGACLTCKGLGVKLVLDPELIIPNPRLTLAQGAIRPLLKMPADQNRIFDLLKNIVEKYRFSLDMPVEKMTLKQRRVLFYGEQKNEKTKDLTKNNHFLGIIAELEECYKETKSDYLKKELEKYMRAMVCQDCQGKRLNSFARKVTIFEKTIVEIAEMDIEQIFDFFSGLIKNNHKNSNKSKNVLPEQEFKIALPILKEIQKHLSYLKDVGLEYLSLIRSATTLAGGEAQRIKLAAQLGVSLSGLIYILDEPTIGLHARDTERLLRALKNLRDLGNSIIVVEHDADTILAADWVIDLGPGAGQYGGELVAQGTPKEIIKNPKSLTGQYLKKRPKIYSRLIQETKKQKYKKSSRCLKIMGAREFNLKNIDVEIPLNQFVCVTGVSGSGKSTLVIEILAKALARKFYRAKDKPGLHKVILGLNYLDKVINVDQSPIGQTPRSNPATYTGLFTYIRDLFSEVPEAKIRGYEPGQFSFNVKDGGRCQACQGEGAIKVEMQDLTDVYVECQECRGSRYDARTLEIHYRNKNIAEVLAMGVEEALSFFRDIPILYEKLKILWEVGLGYICLGQPATTFSGGEAQRIKLATELGKRATGKTLYILDEPTTGLHFEDTKRLLQVLRKIIEKGNSVLVIEHNLEVIRQADWIIDLGPEGGNKGGYLVASGPPKMIAKYKKSYTGKYL